MSELPVQPSTPSNAAVDPSPVVAKSRRSTIAFFVVAAMLILAAAGLNTAIATLQLNLRKLPVDTRLPLSAVKSEAGPWAQVTIDRALSADMEHELGTKQYIFRDYFDTRRLKPDERDKLLAMSIEDRQTFYDANRKEMIGGRVYFSITYYTGGPDTVPHVADRCYVADGFKPSTWEVLNWPILPREKDDEKNTEVRLINFIDQIDSRQSKPVQVAYFFQVNGTYADDPIFEVRKIRANLVEKRGYHAKIEIRTDVADAREAEPMIRDFLQHVMPDVERVLPDRTTFTQREGK